MKNQPFSKKGGECFAHQWLEMTEIWPVKGHFFYKVVPLVFDKRPPPREMGGCCLINWGLAT